MVLGLTRSGNEGSVVVEVRLIEEGQEEGEHHMTMVLFYGL